MKKISIIKAETVIRLDLSEREVDTILCALGSTHDTDIISSNKNYHTRSMPLLGDDRQDLYDKFVTLVKEVKNG